MFNTDRAYPNEDTISLGKITRIEIRDGYLIGFGGCAMIKRGGVGQSFVVLHFASQIDHGFYFSVDLYGI